MKVLQNGTYNKAYRTEHAIRRKLGARLNKLGSITVKDFWRVCGDEYPYHILYRYFKVIMEDLAENDRAEKIQTGVYWIYRQAKLVKQ